MIPQSKTALQRNDYLLLALAGGLILVWNVISWRFPFFWDTVLNSRTASWYLQTGFSQVTVPEILDAGHPPFFSLYLAGIWKLFGRSLTVSHLAMLPFLGFLLVQFHRLTLRWLGPQGRVWAMALLFCEPTFLAQASMVTPDIALVAFYLLAINSLLSNKRAWTAVALVLMASMSFRGILMVGTVFLTDVALAWLSGHRRPNLRKIWPYLPVAALTALWMWVHWRAVGWLMSPPPETYGGQRQVLGIGGIARNVALIGWRLMDFGRVFLWAFVAIGALAIGRRKLLQLPAIGQAMAAMLALVGGLALLFAPFSNPPGHRYFLAGYLLLVAVAAGLAELGEWKPKWKAALVAVMLGMATGHLWMYPRGVAQGWDASLAHVPIFSLQVDANAYLNAQGISPQEVCADFPLLHSPEHTRLEPVHGQAWYRNFLDEADCEWALVSNINNGYTTEQLDDFEQADQWEMKREFQNCRLFIRIYHRR
ncbi:MAG TPA: hypothetical protein VHS96_01135 [Bacteroidia bacterium]|nr:hypothetical protein [Bacteroidia bacterium]